MATGKLDFMAYTIPSDLSATWLAGGGTSELTTLARLKTDLPDAYTVYHGVHWSRVSASNTPVFGEIDFVVVNRAGDILVIEQKDGALEESDAGLVKVYGGQRKNVGDQVRRALEGVREKFKRANPGPQQPGFDYLVFCPDHRVRALNAAGIDRERIVDAGASDRLAQRIQSILAPGTGSGLTERVHAFFRQTFELVPDIHAHVSAHERQFTHLGGGLAEAVAAIEMEPLRLRVRGTAGCGKSLIALAAYERALAAGRRPLLVCFNRPLAERFRGRAPPGGLAHTFDGLCNEFLKAHGVALDFGTSGRDPAFWPNLRERVVDFEVGPEWTFDSLIIDEGQDFEAGWWDIVRLFVRDDADMLWLEDAGQNIRGNPPLALEGFVGYRTRRNFRTPQRVARFIRRAIRAEFEAANALPGLGARVTTYDGEEDQARRAGHVVQELLGMGFRHADIAVLSCRGLTKSSLYAATRLGNVTLRRFTGTYDLFGNPESTAGQVLLDSIWRFKGLQVPAAVIVDVPREDEPRREALLFTAMTRATVRLEVLAPARSALAALAET